MREWQIYIFHFTLRFTVGVPSETVDKTAYMDIYGSCYFCLSPILSFSAYCWPFTTFLIRVKFAEMHFNAWEKRFHKFLMTRFWICMNINIHIPISICVNINNSNISVEARPKTRTFMTSAMLKWYRFHNSHLRENLGYNRIGLVHVICE